MRRYHAGMLLAYAATLFLSATLLFLVQPMIAKMVLPLLGGTPAVWNTCMLFFQAALLAGYAYAHLTPLWLGVRRQAVLHLVLLLTPLLVLPIAVPERWIPQGDVNPIPWLLGLLLVSVGLPFLMISTSAPLLQKWFASTGHPSAQDPYFLYGASNLGSMLALLSYPALIEPRLPLAARTFLSQSWLWAVGYGLLVLCTALCAWLMWRSPTGAAPGVKPSPKEAKATSAARVEPPRFSATQRGPKKGSAAATVDPRSADPGRPSVLLRLRWIALALIPSSLMLGVTTYISTDIASLPLIWVVPLALYLLSFILVFSRLPALLHQGMVLLMPVLVLLLLFLMLSGIKPSMLIVIVLHLLTFFVVAMVCHGELAQSRPSTEYLTQFYLLMSVGGALGGLFNAIVAPLAFHGVAEYMLVLVIACLLLPCLRDSENLWLSRALDAALPVGLGLFTLGVLFLLGGEYEWVESVLGWIHARMQDGLRLVGSEDNGFSKGRLILILQLGLPAVLCYAMVARPIRFGLAVAGIVVAHGLYMSTVENQALHQERSFFGVLRVEVEPGTQAHKLVHGTTLHGKQRFVTAPDTSPCYVLPLAALNPIEAAVALAAGLQEAREWVQAAWDQQHEPLTYYHRTGPIGHIFETLEGPRRQRPMAVIGLGTGTMSCYGLRDQEVTFYDIDRAVERIATNPKYFTYVLGARERGVRVDVVFGDARLRLQQAPAAHYGVIVVDAFSSDAIPIHLLTREAIQLYLEKLAAQGILIIHISNRHLELEPVLGNVARDLGLAGRVQVDRGEEDPNKTSSDWVVLARQDSDLGELAEHEHWLKLDTKPEMRVWTDDFSNLLSIFNWK